MSDKSSEEWILEHLHPLARELGMSRTTVTELRHLNQQNAAQQQPETPVQERSRGGNR